MKSEHCFKSSFYRLWNTHSIYRPAEFEINGIYSYEGSELKKINYDHHESSVEMGSGGWAYAQLHTYS